MICLSSLITYRPFITHPSPTHPLPTTPTHPPPTPYPQPLPIPHRSPTDPLPTTPTHPPPIPYPQPIPVTYPSPSYHPSDPHLSPFDLTETRAHPRMVTIPITMHFTAPTRSITISSPSARLAPLPNLHHRRGVVGWSRGTCLEGWGGRGSRCVDWTPLHWRAPGGVGGRTRGFLRWGERGSVRRSCPAFASDEGSKRRRRGETGRGALTSLFTCFNSPASKKNAKVKVRSCESVQPVPCPR